MSYTKQNFYEGQTLTHTHLNNIEKGIVKVENLASANFANKIISVMGDSISTFNGSIPSGNATFYPKFQVTSADLTWWSKLISYLGAKLGINNSWSGSRVSNSEASNTGNLGPDRCMAGLTRIQTLDDNGTPDIILFFGGTNDIYQKVNLGTFDKNAKHDTVNLSTNTWSSFADAYKDAIMRMQYYYPYAQIVCITPMYCTASADYNALLDSYVKIIRDISDYFGTHFIDLRKCNINLVNRATKNGLMGDATHPNVNGMAMIAKYIYRRLITMMQFDEIDNASTNYKVTYKYVNSSGVTVKVSTTETVEEGTVLSIFTSNAPTISGYTIKSVSPNGSVVVNSDTTITYVYDANGEDATVWYIDHANQLIENDVTPTSGLGTSVGAFAFLDEVNSVLVGEPINTVQYFVHTAGTFTFYKWNKEDDTLTEIETVTLTNPSATELQTHKFATAFTLSEGEYLAFGNTTDTGKTYYAYNVDFGAAYNANCYYKCGQGSSTLGSLTNLGLNVGYSS